MITHCPACGVIIHQEPPRSVAQNARYHAMLAAYYDNWPESNERQFTDRKDFRIWAQMSAGYRTIGAQIPLAGVSKEIAKFLVETGIRGSGAHAMTEFQGTTLVIYKPRSIAFDKMGHTTFTRLVDDVTGFLEKETGFSVEKLFPDRKLEQPKTETA